MSHIELNYELRRLKSWEALLVFITKLEGLRLSLKAKRSHRYSDFRRAYGFSQVDEFTIQWLYDDGATSGERRIDFIWRSLEVCEGKTLPYINIIDGAEVW